MTKWKDSKNEYTVALQAASYKAVKLNNSKTFRDLSRFPESANKRDVFPHPGGPSSRVILQK